MNSFNSNKIKYNCNNIYDERRFFYKTTKKIVFIQFWKIQKFWKKSNFKMLILIYNFLKFFYIEIKYFLCFTRKQLRWKNILIRKSFKKALPKKSSKKVFKKKSLKCEKKISFPKKLKKCLKKKKNTYIVTHWHASLNNLTFWPSFTFRFLFLLFFFYFFLFYFFIYSSCFLFEIQFGDNDFQIYYIIVNNDKINKIK